MELLHIESAEKHFLLPLCEVERVVELPPALASRLLRGEHPERCVLGDEICSIEMSAGTAEGIHSRLCRGTRLVQLRNDNRIVLLCELVVGIVTLDPAPKSATVISGLDFTLLSSEVIKQRRYE